jgi:hypothetical protein
LTVDCGLWIAERIGILEQARFAMDEDAMFKHLANLEEIELLIT